MIIFYLKVDPPHTTTVHMTMIKVEVKMTCLASVRVFLMASAKAMAPLSPDKNNCNFFFKKRERNITFVNVKSNQNTQIDQRGFNTIVRNVNSFLY